MAFTNPVSRFPEIKSQRQIALEKSWWKERFMLYGIYLWKPYAMYHDSFRTTLSGYRWHHHQIQIGPVVIEFRIRGKAQ